MSYEDDTLEAQVSIARCGGLAKPCPKELGRGRVPRAFHPLAPSRPPVQGPLSWPLPLSQTEASTQSPCKGCQEPSAIACNRSCHHGCWGGGAQKRGVPLPRPMARPPEIRAAHSLPGWPPLLSLSLGAGRGGEGPPRNRQAQVRAGPDSGTTPASAGRWSF